MLGEDDVLGSASGHQVEGDMNGYICIPSVQDGERRDFFFYSEATYSEKREEDSDDTRQQSKQYSNATS